MPLGRRDDKRACLGGLSPLRPRVAWVGQSCGQIDQCSLNSALFTVLMYSLDHRLRYRLMHPIELFAARGRTVFIRRSSIVYLPFL
jgi:hypothetical protein